MIILAEVGDDDDDEAMTIPQTNSFIYFIYRWCPWSWPVHVFILLRLNSFFCVISELKQFAVYRRIICDFDFFSLCFIFIWFICFLRFLLLLQILCVFISLKLFVLVHEFMSAYCVFAVQSDTRNKRNGKK